MYNTSMEDITSIKQIKQELKESEERFRLAMLGANDGLWDWNLETDTVYYSSRWKSMLGYEEHELENTFATWEKLVFSEDKEMVLKKVEDNFAGTTKSFEVEMRMNHKNGHHVFVLSRAFLVRRLEDSKAIRFVGTHVDITEQKRMKAYDDQSVKILKMIATGVKATSVYDEIALMYEGRHKGLRCSLLELEDGKLLHGGAPSMPKEYCDAVHGLQNGPNVGSCGTSTYFGQRVLVEDIETDSKWENIKEYALPHGMRSCWSEPILDSSGKVLGAFGMYYNHPALPNDEESEDLLSAARLAGIVMERDQSQKRIRELAYSDELTKIANRASFYRELEKLIYSSERTKKSFGLLYMDLDDFKGVNDTLGHDNGDILLKEIATRLEAVCRDSDFVARLSGDEFCVLIGELEDDYTSSAVAQRCLDAVSRPVELTGRIVVPSCSIGIGHFPDDAKDFSTIMKVTDTALYYAKEQGKNQYAFYKSELSRQAEYRFKMEQGLREAIEKEELTLVYQPQIDTKTNKVFGFEALARWNHKSLGNIAPVEFIPIIERIGMMKQFTRWVVFSACTQAVIWKKLNKAVFKMSVNISPKYFLDQDMVPLIKETINKTGILASDLVLEVTESVVQTDERNLSIFQSLKELGVSIAIDDFGIGYSSFASLKHLTFDHLKIDKYFIDEILTDLKVRFLVRSMIELGQYMEYGIVVEGVEQKEQLVILEELGCEIVQGYFFSKPIESGDVLDYLHKIEEER